MTRNMKIAFCSLVAIMITIFITGLVVLVNMLIDHECYQLAPGEFYNNSICEKYWK